ncbi:MAG TPA: 3-hydroxyacyl-CoA dehydrogenase family protein, partial [Acidobacteriota bacterium]
MGAQIAAHLANASVPSLLFDLPGLAKQSLARLTKMDPAPLFDRDLVSLIAPLEFESDFKRLKEADWILEAVVEDLDVKRKLLQSILPHIRPDALITSNTSGLPLSQIAAEMPSDFKKRWFGTHFFNPPRYLKLLELIPTPESDPKLLHDFADFSERALGKGTVYAKDTPNFIANRIGLFAALKAIQLMQSGGFTIEDIDFLTGPLIGRARSATFRTIDMVGLDIFAHVADNIHRNAPGDPQREVFRVPDFMRSMLDRKMLGAKTGRGFYKKDGDQILTLDLATMEYRPQQRPNFPEIEMVSNIEGLPERLQALSQAKGRSAAFVSEFLGAISDYAASRIPEISDDR